MTPASVNVLSVNVPPVLANVRSEPAVDQGFTTPLVVLRRQSSFSAPTSVLSG